MTVTSRIKSSKKKNGGGSQTTGSKREYTKIYALTLLKTKSRAKKTKSNRQHAACHLITYGNGKYQDADTS